MDPGLLISAISNYPFKTFRYICKKLGIAVSGYEGWIINSIVPSTITVGGKFSGVSIHEERDTDRFIPTGNIVHVGSNYGEYVLPGWAPPVKPTVAGNKRGRKPKPKLEKKRIVGNGKYFNSQISMVVRSTTIRDKVYKFKLFRTGVFQVPGVLNTDLSDLEAPITELQNFLSNILKTEVKMVSRHVQMRNCKSILSDLSLRINTVELGKIVEREQQGPNPMKIFQVIYNTAQNSCKTTIKFLRPTTDNNTKQTTLKVLTQKINFEGAVEIDDIRDISTWLNNVLITNYYQCIISGDTPPIDDSAESEPDLEPDSDSDSDFKPDVSDFDYSSNPYLDA